MLYSGNPKKAIGMRLVWRKRFGFSLVAYPVEAKPENLGGFKAGIFDSGGDLWWFSDETTIASAGTESLAYIGWTELLTEFLESSGQLPDGSNPGDIIEDIDRELAYAKLKIEVPTLESNEEPVKNLVSRAIKDLKDKEEPKDDDAKSDDKEAKEAIQPVGESGTGSGHKEPVESGT